MKLKFASLLFGIISIAVVPVFAADLAVVNSKAIPASRLETAVKQAIAQGQKDTPELRASLKNQLIEQEVLLQEAEKRGYSKKPEVLAAIEQARKSLPIRAMMEDIGKATPVTDADIQNAYDAYKLRVGTTEYDASHILVKTESEAKAIIAKIKAGSKFEDLAKDSIDVGSGSKGGKLGWAPASNYVEPFAKALASLGKGQITDTPVQTKFGFHVIRVDDTRPIKVPSLEELKPRIVESLREKKMQSFAEELRRKAIVK